MNLPPPDDCDPFFRLIENAPFGMYLVDAKFRLKRVSVGARKVFGQVEPLLGRDFAEVLRQIWTEPFASDAIGRFRHTLESGESYASPQTTERRQDVDAVESYDWKIERVTLPDGQFGVVCYFHETTAHEAERESRERYQVLFDSIDEGFCVIEVIFDAEGKPVDYRFEQANPMFSEFTGLKDAMGKTALELVPDLEPFWVETYGRAAVTGEPARFEYQSEAMGRWFDVHASRLGGEASRRVAIVFNNITERKRAELALTRLTARSEQQRRLYETIFSSTLDLIYVFDLNHQFVYANEALLQMWGRTWDDAIGKTCLELGYEPWHAKMHDEEIERVIATGRPIRGEVPFVGTNGRRIYDYIFAPVLSADGTVEAIAGTTRDVTESREAAEAIRQKTAQFETLLNQAPLGVYLVDDQFRLSHVNPKAHQVFRGIPNVVGRPFEEVLEILWPKDFADELARIFRHTLETGEPYSNAEAEARRRDIGTREVYEWRVDRITLPNGKNGAVCYFQDVSAQVRARALIAESEERFRTLVSILTDVPWVADARGAFVARQTAWEEFTGQSWEEYRDFRWMDALHAGDREEFARKWRHACESRSLFESHGRLWHAETQRYRHFVARASPLIQTDGAVHEWVGTCTDVDEQKRAEAALRVARDEAENASRAKDRFLAVLSHELRTPLTPVLLALAALQHDSSLSAEAREDLAMMKRNIELETKLIDDLLDLSRITNGKLALKLETIDLLETLQRVCAICQPDAGARGVQLSLELFTGRTHVTVDAARLQQVFWNVIRNAIKFTPAGGTISVSVKSIAGDRCEVRVSDTGAGIPAEALPNIFDAFEQGGAKITQQFGGLGLGLAISRTLVELHGGTIRAESAGEGKGSTFFIEIPASSTAGPEAGSSQTASGAAATPPLRLLLVEDHADTLRTLARMLRRAGFEVLTASGLSSAVAVAAAESFDVLVSDIGLPDGDGFQVLQSIRQHREVPGIAMSGFGMEEDMHRTRAAGFSEHLVKPIEVPQLVAAIRRVREVSAGR